MVEKEYYRQNQYKAQRGVEEGNLLTSNGMKVNQADIMRRSHTPFGEKIGVNKHPVITLQSHHGLSVQRDYIKEDGIYQSTTFTSTPSGRVSNTTGKYEVSVNGVSQSTHFETGQTGVYISGYQAEVGIGVMMNDEVEAGVEYRWGYFDDLSGFGYLKDSTGLYLFVRSNGVDTLVGQKPNQSRDNTVEKLGWNVDMVDGSGGKSNASHVKLNLSRGWMFQMRYLHYGFGSIGFYLNYVDNSGNEQKLLIHRFERENEIIFDNPNLPISAHVESDTTYAGTKASMFVGGRQMSILGDYEPLYRFSDTENRVDTVDAGWTPVVSAQMSSNRRGIQNFIDGISVSTDQDIKWGLFVNPVLGTTPNFQAPLNTASDTRNADETSMNFDVASTTIADGLQLYGDILEGGKNNEAVLQSISSKLLSIPRDRIVSFAVKRKTATNANVFALMRVRQEF